MTAAAALVLGADFPWGDFQDHPHWAGVSWTPFASPPLRVIDIGLNVLLGVPVGIVAARYFQHSLVISILITLAASLAGEWTQLYSHTRFPSATDMVCNIGGAIAACVVLGAMGEPSRKRPE